MVNQSLPFAQALLEIGQESHQEKHFYEVLSELNDIYTENPDLEKLMDAPQVHAPEKIQVLNELFSKDLDETMMNFLQVLVRHRMAGKIPQIFKDYTKLYNQAMNIEEVKVYTPAPLEDAQIEKLKAMLSRKLGKEVHMQIDIDPSLIAGLRIETESRTLDNSYAGRLEKMKEQLQKA